MLVLSRKQNQKIVIGGGIEIVVLEARNGKVRLGVTAPDEISVDRHEIYVAKQATPSNAAGVEQQGHRVGRKSPSVTRNPYLVFPRKPTVQQHVG